MSRKKVRNLVIECLRRAYLKQHGTLRGFGEVMRFYNDSFFKYNPRGGYRKVWEDMGRVRATVGM